MTYRETARRFALAESSTAATLAADKLPTSEWAEARRDTMTPATIAQNHALHVSDCAAELREYESAKAGRLTIAARALLAAIGEGE